MHFELCMRGEELADAATLASAVPDTQLVLDHVGNPTFDGRDLSQWRDGLAGVAEHENVVCKISGLLENVDDAARVTDFGAVVEHARACFGPDRIMFGSNWPVCTIHGSTRLWLESLQEITSSWSDSDRAALFEVNAARFYRIDPAD